MTITFEVTMYIRNRYIQATGRLHHDDGDVIKIGS